MTTNPSFAPPRAGRRRHQGACQCQACQEKALVEEFFVEPEFAANEWEEEQEEEWEEERSVRTRPLGRSAVRRPMQRRSRQHPQRVQGRGRPPARKGSGRPGRRPKRPGLRRRRPLIGHHYTGLGIAPGSEFVRWVQQSLNQVLGLSLPVNGIMDSATRDAIRNFQQSKGLPADGIVGPDTQQALIAARSGGPAATDATAPVNSPAPTGAAGPTDDAAATEEEFVSSLWNYLTGAGSTAGPVNRNSPEYIKWVQRSLNQILGLKLTVDGISGAQTRSAVRSFQQRRGLTADGIVGAQTEAALIAAGAGQPPGGSAPVYAPPSTPGQSPPGGQSLSSNIARIAVQEWQRWGQGASKECDSSMRSTLEDYWRTGVGYVPSQSNYCSSVAWSAAFISWVMRKAGAGSAFRYSGRHTDYVGAAKQNRVANNSNPFKAYRITEISPRVGDLVCQERENSGVTYDNVDQGSFASHCDIVVEVQPGQIKTIGGNLSDSVRQNTVRTDANGRVNVAGYYAVVRVGA